ncbi:MAG TPA: SCO family protein [Hyphomicrobiaceae bacterium]|nr:SCO family protein [Hyphomicrobiaceae bacterium]
MHYEVDRRRLSLLLGAAIATAIGMPCGTAAAAEPHGGPFELIGTDGQPFRSERLAGRPFAIFFGFTNCPEVCPTTLNDLMGVLERLGPDADRIGFLFVSVDAENDTPAALKEYLSHFDKRVIGLTGHPAEIAAVASRFGAYYERVPTKHGHTYHHSTSMYLVGGDGRRAGEIAYQEDADSQVRKFKALMK